MTDIEDLVQSTTRALAGTVSGIRPLPPLPQEPSPDEVSRKRGWHARRARGWLIPLAAAASVLLIVAASMLAAHLTSRAGRPGPAAATASAPRPEFYMTAMYPSKGPNVLQIQVRRTAGGAVTASTTIPAANMGWGNTITAAASDRAFFIGHYPCRSTEVAVTTFYRITITDSGRISGISAVGHVQGMLQYLAVSPDGSQMAYASVPGACGNAKPWERAAGAVSILDLSTGVVRTWQYSTGQNYVTGLSWAPNARTLVIDEYSRGLTGALTVLGLDAADGGGSLQADSTILLQRSGRCSNGPTCVTGAVAGPGDSLTALEYQRAGQQTRTLVVSIALPAGSPQTVLYSKLSDGPAALVDGDGLYADPSGQWVLLWPDSSVSTPQRQVVFPAGWISGGRLHHMTGAGEVFPEGIAW
jgi:hypothetical protein